MYYHFQSGVYHTQRVRAKYQNWFLDVSFMEMLACSAENDLQEKNLCNFNSNLIQTTSKQSGQLH